MLKYIALIWNAKDGAQAQTASSLAHRIELQHPTWRSLRAAEGIELFYSAEPDRNIEIRPTAGRTGVVLGQLFMTCGSEGAAVPAEVELGTSLTRMLLQDDGRAFLERCWGRYVALIRQSSGEALILADPTGECACQWLEYRGVTLMFAQVADIAALGLTKLTINWQYVAASLFQRAPCVRDTGFNEVSQLRAGEALRIGPDGHKRGTLCWDLFSLARQAPLEDLETAVTHARRTLYGCVGALVSNHPRLVHLLSGLDSSIVLACLLAAPSRPEIHCLNLYDPSVGGDERHFTRLAAQSIHGPDGRRSTLTEYERNLDLFDLDALSRITLSACPFAYVASAAYREIYRRAALPLDAVLSTGLGGDYLFSRTSSARPAIDYVHDHGLGRDLFRIIRDSTGSSTYWRVTAEALAGGLRRRPLPRRSIPGEWAFVNPDIVQQFATDTTGYLQPLWRDSPALRGRGAVAPSKRQHIETMYRPVRMHDPFATSGAQLQWCAPLLCQPIMELFARIPLYVLRAGGVERMVARKAFAHVIPRQVIERRSKGVTNSFIFRLFRRRQRFFRDLLLDGTLVKERLLDRRHVEGFFSDAQDGYAEGQTQLLGTPADLELWLRSSQQYPCSPAVAHEHSPAAQTDPQFAMP